LIGRIVVTHGAQVVLVGAGGDRATAEQILGTAPFPGVADWTGRTSVAELAALLEQADLVVGTDSGPAHLAAAVGTPAVVLFSGTNSLPQWQPRGEHVRVIRRAVACSPCHRHRCPLAGHPCMSGIAPSEVADAVESLHRHTVAHGKRQWKRGRRVDVGPGTSGHAGERVQPC
jgi:ADP-heptose:LPS heptosyltransferase